MSPRREAGIGERLTNIAATGFSLAWMCADKARRTVSELLQRQGNALGQLSLGQAEPRPLPVIVEELPPLPPAPAQPDLPMGPAHEWV